MTREEFIADMIGRDMVGLEIGPSYAPAFPKSDGWNIETVDHDSADKLKEKYVHKPEAVNIEEVDYIWQGGNLADLFPNAERYDFIYASYVIEHMIDPIGFMQSCETLLKPNGKLILIVPDKRQCFDFLRPINSLGNLLDSHGAVSRKHRRSAIFDFYAYSADLGGHAIWESHWAETFGIKPSFSHEDVLEAFNIHLKVVNSEGYSDVHAWNFVPSSFRLIMNDLARIGLINLREIRFGKTPRCEFYFAASKDGSGPSSSRIEIMRDAAREQISGLSQVIAA